MILTAFVAEVSLGGFFCSCSHIGNYGVTPADDESGRVWAAGLVVRSLSPVVSNWRARQSLEDYLAERHIVAITEVDTRALVRYIRDKGAMNAVISTEVEDLEALQKKLDAIPSMDGLELASKVSTKEP